MMDFQHLLKSFLDDQNRLTAFPAKRKKKVYALAYLASKLDPKRVYTESAFNDALEELHTFHDPATLRRELYNNGFIDRQNNGQAYWLEETQPDLMELESRFG